MNFKHLATCSVVTWVMFLLSSIGQAQDTGSTREKVDFPESDIFLFKVTNNKDGIRITECKNVSDKSGYENQPFFTADSSSFLFSQSDDYQTDVYEYFLESGKVERVTSSVNMEFSPMPSPDNKTISFVTDGEGANQSVWHLNRDAAESPIWTLKHLPEREPVGYYSWNHESGYILFWSRYGHSIRLVHQSKELSRYICGHAVPTTPWIIPGTNKFSFVHRQANGEVWIKELDPETRSVRPLVPISGSNHHYNWAPDGSIWNIQGSSVFRWKEGAKNGWEKVQGDLKEAGIESATRVALSPDGKWLALVGVAN